MSGRLQDSNAVILFVQVPLAISVHQVLRPSISSSSRHPRHHHNARIPKRYENRITYLQHVQEGSLSGIIETEEEKLGVLVEEAKRGEDVVDYSFRRKSR